MRRRNGAMDRRAMLSLKYDSMKQIFLFSAIMLAFCTSCADSDSTTTAETPEETTRSSDSTVTQVKLPGKLDEFATIPDTIDGCGDYYAVENDSATKGNYIFLSNISEFAIIRVEGKDIYLKKNDSLSKEITPDHFISVFEGSGLKVTLEAKIVDQYDEGGFYKGTLEIDTGTEKRVINVHGESGC
jgi:hypothetical protein